MDEIETLSDARFLRLARALLGVSVERASAVLGATPAALLHAERRVSSQTEDVPPSTVAFGAGYARALDRKGFEVRLDRDLVWIEARRATGAAIDESLALAAAIEATGTAPKDLAKAAGVSQDALSNSLKGSGSVEDLDLVARALARRGVAVKSRNGRLTVGVGDADWLLNDAHVAFPTEDRGPPDADRAFRNFNISIKSLTLMVELEHSHPRVWREIAVPQTLTMAEVHEVLQTAFGWNRSHLYTFNVGLGVSSPEFLNERSAGDPKDLPANRVRLQDVRRDTFAYEYDMGDGWRHRVTVVGRESNATIPCVMDGQGAVIDDMGGPIRRNDIVAGLASFDPAEVKEAKRFMRDWRKPADWAFEGFDKDAANAELKRMFKPVAKDWNEHVARHGFD